LPAGTCPLCKPIDETSAAPGTGTASRALIYFDVVLLAAAIGLHACRGATRRELAKYAIVILALVSLGAVVLYVIDSREQGGGTIKIDDLPFQR